VQAKHFVVYESSQWQLVEQISEQFPNVRRSLFLQTFVLKTLNLSYLSCFVITSKNGKSCPVAYFECS